MYIGYENAWIILRYEENFTVVMIFIIRSISFGLYLTHSLLIRCPYLGIFFFKSYVWIKFRRDFLRIIRTLWKILEYKSFFIFLKIWNSRMHLTFKVTGKCFILELKKKNSRLKKKPKVHAILEFRTCGLVEQTYTHCTTKINTQFWWHYQFHSEVESPCFDVQVLS